MYNIYTAHQQTDHQPPAYFPRKQKKQQGNRRQHHFKKNLPSTSSSLVSFHDETVLQRVVDAVLQDGHDGSLPLQPQQKSLQNSSHHKLLRRDSYSTFTTAVETPETRRPTARPAVVQTPADSFSDEQDLLPLLIEIPTMISVEEPLHNVAEDARQDQQEDRRRPPPPTKKLPAPLLGPLFYGEEIDEEEEEIFFVPDDLESTETGTSSTVQPPYPRFPKKTGGSRSSVSITKNHHRTRRPAHRKQYTPSTTASSAASYTSGANKSTRSAASSANSSKGPSRRIETGESPARYSSSSYFASGFGGGGSKAGSIDTSIYCSTRTGESSCSHSEVTTTMRSLRRLPSVGLETLQPPSRNCAFTPPKQLHYPTSTGGGSLLAPPRTNSRNSSINKRGKKTWSPSASFRMTRLEI